MAGPEWGRWVADDGSLGRWHVIADHGMGFTYDGVVTKGVLTACGESRILPPHVAQVPGAPVCPTCEQLDRLRTEHQRSGIRERPALVSGR